MLSDLAVSPGVAEAGASEVSVTPTNLGQAQCLAARLNLLW